MLWVCSRVRELHSAATVTLEISSRNSRVAALQKRWDRLRAGLDLILDQRGAEMADLPGASAGCWCAATRARKPTNW
jgi:hypothetical protein